MPYGSKGTTVLDYLSLRTGRGGGGQTGRYHRPVSVCPRRLVPLQCNGITPRNIELNLTLMSFESRQRPLNVLLKTNISGTLQTWKLIYFLQCLSKAIYAPQSVCMVNYQAGTRLHTEGGDFFGGRAVKERSSFPATNSDLGTTWNTF